MILAKSKIMIFNQSRFKMNAFISSRILMLFVVLIFTTISLYALPTKAYSCCYHVYRNS